MLVLRTTLMINRGPIARTLASVACLLAVLTGTGTAATVWEFKFNETGTAPANTGTGNPTPALVTRQAFYGSASDLHGADASGVSGQAGDRALDLSGITTNGGVYPGMTFNPQINVAVANCTPIQNLTTLTLSGWFNARAPIATGTYKGEAKLMTFSHYSGGNLGFGVEFSTTDSAKNQLKVVLDAASLYFDVTPAMTFTDINKWYFWAVTYDGTLGANNTKVYMGTPGASVAQMGVAQTANYGALETTTTDFSLNGGNGSGTIKGLQDNVRVDNVVMDLAQLEARRVMDAAADIAVYGKGNLIAGGDLTPVIGDGTDFGSAMPADITLTNSFSITNAGADVLYLTGTQPVTLSGHTGDFILVTGGLATNIAAHSSTTFKVVFAPTTTGTRTGLVSVANTVAAKNPYRFAIQGNGIGVEPVIGVMGKGVGIGNADMAPDASDGTDSGGADIAGVSVTNTFSITNAGLALLTLTGGTPVTLTGDTGDFSIDTAGLSATVAAGSSTSFKLIFDPSTAGIKTGIVSIASNDGFMNPFTFAVRGTGLKPAIMVSGNGVPITAGDTTPALADATDFGGTDLLIGVPVTNVFTITNQGTAILSLTGAPPVGLTGHTSDFTVSQDPATTIGVGASTTFKIVFTPTVIGIRTGTVSIANNDGDKTPYTFGFRAGATVAINSIPYSETFESYPDGTMLAATNGWTAQYTTMGVVTNHTYTNSYAGAFPVAGPHQMSYRIDGRVTNSFSASSHSNVWVDMILEAKHWTNNTMPSGTLLSNAQFALYITTNRHLAVWNCPAPPTPACAWTELLDTDIPPDSFIRVTVEMDYARDATNYFHYRVWVNETLSTNPKTWYAAATTNASSLRKITAEGLFHMDDLTVRTVTPYAPVSIVASSLGYGSILPAGTIVVPYGESASFTNLPAPWYHVGTVTVDGASMGVPPVYSFTNVKAGHTIITRFAADTVSSNTPNWWLAEANPAWTNDLDTASLDDQDGDGVSTWEEYLAGTHPTNPASVFNLHITASGNQWLVTAPTIEPGVQYEGLNRYYSIETRTNLLTGSWEPVPELTDVRATGQVLTCTNSSLSTNRFYRAKVRLAP